MNNIKFLWKFYYNLHCSKLYENTKTVKMWGNLQKEHGGQLWACKTVKCQACFLSPKLLTGDQTQYPCEDCQLSRKKIITICIIFKQYQHKINVVHISTKKQRLCWVITIQGVFKDFLSNQRVSRAGWDWKITTFIFIEHKHTVYSIIYAEKRGVKGGGGTYCSKGAAYLIYLASREC